MTSSFCSWKCHWLCANLRSLFLQPCTFKVDYTLPTAPGMEFGSVFIREKPENLAALVVAAGWAKVSTPSW